MVTLRDLQNTGGLQDSFHRTIASAERLAKGPNVMKNALVVLVNPNKVHPGISPYALDILATSLEQDEFQVEVLDLTFKRDRWKAVVRDYFSSRDPLLVGLSIRNTDTISPQEQKTFVEDHLEIVNEIKKFTHAPIVAGGVGFSSMPYALLEYLDLPYGVKGPGELIICKLANALLKGQSPRTVPGLLIYDGEKVDEVYENAGMRHSESRHLPRIQSLQIVNRSTPYTRRSGVAWQVDNLEYYREGGLGNFITKNGCPFACTHCLEPDAKGRFLSERSVTAVVEELECLARQGIHDVHSTDSEFNLDLKYAKAILREIVGRKDKDAASPLHDLRIWVYCQPRPFDAEFALLLSKAGCKGANVSADHSVQELINPWKVNGGDRPYYTFQDVKETNRLLRNNGILVMIEILLGMPGETIASLNTCIDDSLALNATVVGYTLGIRIFPYSPLGIRLANESNGTAIRGLQSNSAISPIRLKPLQRCQSIIEYERQFMFDEYNRLRPLFYFSPELPESEYTVSSPNGRWIKTLQHMREYIPAKEHYRVMLPTNPGISKDDNNYCDNPFLMCLVKLGYKGAFWARWRQRDQIIKEAIEKGIVKIERHEEYVFSSTS